MSGFIIFVIVLVFVLKAMRRDAVKRESRPGNEPAVPYRNVTGSSTTKATRAAVPARPQNNTQSKPVQPVTEVPVENSTMDYLAEKAEKEERETKREQRSYAAGNVGRRMPDWGNPASGEMVVTCANCGAENILPRGARQHSYTCYFCREQL